MRAVLLFLFTLLIVAPGISSLPPLDRDEARFIQATKQMAETGNHIDIRFQDDVRYKKPIGIYWMQSAAVALSGDGAAAPIWVYRLVSVFSAAFAVLAVWRIGARMFGADGGLAAALVVAGLVAVAFEGRVAKTDAALLLFCVLAQGALARLYLSARSGKPAGSAAPYVFWAAQGCAILIKGPIAPLLSALTVAGLWAFERDAAWLRGLKPLRGLALAAVIVLPWLALISWKSGAAFWQEAVGRDLVGKVAGGEESHGAPPGYYALTYSLFVWPFGLLGVAAAVNALNIARTDSRLRFCLAWYLPFWLVMEAVPTKLPHYMLPAYPALALLAGWLLALPRSERLPSLRRWQSALYWMAATGFAIVTLALCLALVAAPLYLGDRLSAWNGLAALLVLIAGWLAAPLRNLDLRRVGLAAAAAGAAYAVIFGIVAPALSTLWLSPRIAGAVRASRPCPKSVVASATDHEPSLVFLLGTRTIMTDAAGAARHLAEDRKCGLALVGSAVDSGFRDRLASAGIVPQQLARIEGLNYSSGARLALTLYRAGTAP